MNLNELKAAAEAALTPDTDRDLQRKGYMPKMIAYYTQANPATILKLIAVVEFLEARLP